MPSNVGFTESIYSEESFLEKRAAMNDFLVSVERRALVMARMAVSPPEEALDLVQDAMLQLVDKYSDKPAEEWRVLFFTILQNRIRDWYRRQQTRSRWQVVLSSLKLSKQEDDELELELEQLGPAAMAADSRVEAEVDRQRGLDELQLALRRLPERQRQAFLLRAWMGFDVKETAQAMSCSTGSVKTHYARALAALRSQLEEYQV